MQDCHLSLHRRAFQSRCQPVQFLCCLGRLLIAPGRDSIVPEEPVPVLFAAGRAGPPAKPDIAFGAVRNLLIGEGAHLARIWIASKFAPPAGPGISLHDPGWFVLEPAHQVAGGGRIEPAFADFFPNRIIVPRHEIEIGCEVVIVQFLEEPHHVMRHKLLRAGGPENSHLIGLESHVQPGLKPFPVQALARIKRVIVGRQCDFRPLRHLMAPEMRAPRGVEGGNGAIPPAQPVVELGPASDTETLRIPEFVIGLPTNDVRCCHEMFSHRSGNALGEQTVSSGGEAVVLAHAPGDPCAALLRGQRFRIFMCHPGWHDGGRRSEHGRDALLGQNGERIIEPGKIELSFCWLQARPGKFCQTHHVKPGLAHQLRVGRPTGRWPMFRIIIYTNIHVMFLLKRQRRKASWDGHILSRRWGTLSTRRNCAAR